MLSTGGTAMTRPLRADAQRNRARILAAAEEVFTRVGPQASTEEVAARAGVAVGTVFRHFPTKDALLSAIMKNLRQRLTEEADALLADGGADDALFTFFSGVVRRAADTRTVVELLRRTGVEVGPDAPVRELGPALHRLLARAQDAGRVRGDVTTEDVVALLTAACHGALRGGWDERLQERVLSIVFAGLAPGGGA